jgi:signal transduction histidine kinase
MRSATTTSRQSLAQEVELASLGLVHDLHHPLSTAAGAFRVLEALLGQADEETRFFRETVRRSLRNASNIVNGWQEVLAAASRPEQRRVVALDDLVKQVLVDLDLQPGQGFQRCSIDSLPAMSVQAEKLRLVFRNLLENARLYARANVPLALVIESRRCRGGHCISIRDNGRGIPHRHRARIFEPFRRIPGSPGAGLGLGLNLAKRVVEQHGGKIWITSRVGTGTTVHFTLPHVDA